MSSRVRRPATLDRYGTHRSFVRDILAGLVKDHGPAVAVIWTVLWDWANARNGLVRGASKSRLARTAGLSRPTCIASINVLIRETLLEVVEDGAVPVYRLVHLNKE